MDSIFCEWSKRLPVKSFFISPATLIKSLINSCEKKTFLYFFSLPQDT